MNTLFRGENYGVFTGPNGYYVASMAPDGISHYQPDNGGNGWGDEVRERCNRRAQEWEENWEEWQ